MDDLVPHIDGRAMFLDRQFDDADRTVDTGAKAARRGDQELEGERSAIAPAVYAIACPA
ncbi:hypothetical protein [Sphingomonas changnyeongensis]|uniref:hypothetical protein n=1 Tax=Sphingomonas changnyeongensis TaxID=2698679 RepID=UPI001E2DC5E5|nr:hypothetical protein [Sphingomonas changnyeongensis]